MLFRQHPTDGYEQQYHRILQQIQDGRIKPVKASGLNGKKPALYREYWILEEKPDFNPILEELNYLLHPAIAVDYYRAHLEIYEQERWAVQCLSAYLKKREEMPVCRISLNERSFEIWGQEKFLEKGQGRRVLKHCGLELSDLDLYLTSEPLPYYTHTRITPQNLLILENKDTFYSIRRHLLRQNGSEAEIFGISIGTLIYGAGKRILKSFQDFEICAEPYMREEKNTLLYFGDLDYEGIGIFENLVKSYQDCWKISPFVPAYETMLRKQEKIENLPLMKEQQNHQIQDVFFSYFPFEQVMQMKQILESGCYIPQEILNIRDFEQKE